MTCSGHIDVMVVQSVDTCRLSYVSLPKELDDLDTEANQGLSLLVAYRRFESILLTQTLTLPGELWKQ